LEIGLRASFGLRVWALGFSGQTGLRLAAAKADSGWRIEDGKARLGARCCAHARNLARSARNGRVSFTGPADELKDDARLKEVYL
jgi:hypothetical protein